MLSRTSRTSGFATDTDTMYIKKSTDIDMNGHRITGLPKNPSTSGEPITKFYFEQHLSGHINIMTFKGTPSNVTMLPMLLISYPRPGLTPGTALRAVGSGTKTPHNHRRTGDNRRRLYTVQVLVCRNRWSVKYGD